MTDPKSRVQLALELADCVPTADGMPSQHWGGTDSDQIANELLKGPAIAKLAVAAANLLLWASGRGRLQSLDERETQLHPIARAHPVTELRHAAVTEFENRVEAWHKGDSDLPLHEFLGLTWEQYAQLLSGKPVPAHPAPTSSPPGWYMCEACEARGATSNLLANGEPWARVCQPCSLDEGVAKGRIRDRRAKTAVLSALTHDGATAAEWASRYASLAAAAYPVLAWLPRNDPGARMVAERLTGVLAGQGERVSTADADRQALDVYRAETMALAGGRTAGFAIGNIRRVAQMLEAQQAELTRLKEENARLSGELEDMRQTALRQVSRVSHEALGQHEETKRYRSKYHAARREVRRLNRALQVTGLLQRSQARNAIDRANEMGDMRRAFADEKTAHEATRLRLTKTAWLLWDARTKAKSELDAEDWGGRADEWLDVVIPKRALSALDRTEGEQAEAPPESPVPAEAPREIRVGSSWRRMRDARVVAVTNIEVVNGLTKVDYASADNNTAGRDNPDRFLSEYTWLSDPEPPAERLVVGEGKL